MSFDSNQGFFTCPLCHKLCNMKLPPTPTDLPVNAWQVTDRLSTPIERILEWVQWANDARNFFVLSSEEYAAVNLMLSKTSKLQYMI